MSILAREIETRSIKLQTWSYDFIYWNSNYYTILFQLILLLFVVLFLAV